jgi:hypothetical protein
MTELSLKDELAAIRKELGNSYSPIQWLSAHDKAIEAMASRIEAIEALVRRPESTIPSLHAVGDINGKPLRPILSVPKKKGAEVSITR